MNARARATVLRDTSRPRDPASSLTADSKPPPISSRSAIGCSGRRSGAGAGKPRRRTRAARRTVDCGRHGDGQGEQDGAQDGADRGAGAEQERPEVATRRGRPYAGLGHSAQAVCRSTRAICTWAGDGQWTHGMASFEVGDEDVPLCSFCELGREIVPKGGAFSEWPRRRSAGAEDALSVCVLTLSLCLPLPPSHPPSFLPGSVRARWLVTMSSESVCLGCLCVLPPIYLARCLACSLAPWGGRERVAPLPHS